jgi:putative spermidine/putrescine transport system permease protein
MMQASSQTAGARWRDPAIWMAAPAVIFMLAVFVYPFIHGLILSFQPLANDGMLSNYIKFFNTENLWMTIGVTLKLALPATLINILIAVPVAYRLRHKTPYQKIATTILVIPITLGTVLIAEGMLTYFGPKGWFAQILQTLHLYEGAIRLTHNYAGVLISLVISGFPFAFLLILSYITGIDPVLPRAAATLGASPFNQFRHVIFPLILPGLAMAFCLSFVQAFSVFPSAVLLGSPAGATRVISIAAYEAAFENYDYSMASAVAMIMGAVQLGVVVIVLGLRNMVYRGPVSGGKG